MLRIRSLKHKITLRVGLAAVLVLAVLIGFVSGTVRQAQSRTVEQLGLTLVANLARHIDDFNREGLAIAETMAVQQQAGGFGHRTDTLRFLHDLIVSRPEYFGTWVLYVRNADGQDAAWIGRPGAHSRTGQFLAFWNPTSTGKKLGAAEDITEDRDVYGIWEQARKPPHTFIMEPYFYNEELQTSYGHAIMIAGRLKGVTGIDRSLSTLHDQLKGEKPYRSAQFVLISPRGRYIVAPDDALTTQPIAKYPGQWEVFKPLVGATRPGAREVRDPFSGQASRLFYTPVATGQWTLAMLVDQDEIQAPVTHLVGTILGLGLGGVVLVLLWLYGLIARAVAPVEPLVRACEATAEGDLDTVQALVTAAPATGEDEFARMGAAFRKAVRYLATMAEQLEQVARGDLSVRISPISERDRVGNALAQYVVTIASTITQLNQTKAELAQSNEQLKHLDRLKTDFVNAVTHDLRTPLTSIKGYVEFLQDGLGGPLTPRQQDFVAQVDKAAVRLERLVDDLLDLARLEAGTFHLALEDADLGAKVADVLDSVRPQAQAAQLTLEAVLPEAPLRVRHDAARIERVFTNLLHNAIKFTPRGGTIRVEAGAVGDQVRLEVQDTGPGIAPEDVPKLFQRFSQLKDGLGKGGTGLGLSISRSIVEAHGGAIGVESGVGRGSTFWFTLPRTGPAAETASREDASAT